MTVLTDQIDRQLQSRDEGIVVGVITAFHSLGYDTNEIIELTVNVLVNEFGWSLDNAQLLVESEAS